MSKSAPIDPALLEAAAEWASLRAEGLLDPSGEAEFAAWLDASPRHAEALERIDVAWLSLAEAATAPELLAMRAQALERTRRHVAMRWARPIFSTRLRAVAAAAVLLIAILGGGLAWRLDPADYETGIGERRVVALEDGSRVSLDAATEVQARFFNGRRQLWLESGRAKFDVAHDPLRPFTVVAGGRTIVATGTSFSVELVNREVRVILYEGSVAVLDAAGRDMSGRRDILRRARAPDARTLVPGRQLVAALDDPAAIATAPIDPMRSRAWESGQLVFDEESLDLAVARLNRYSSQRLAVADGAAARMRVSGVFNAGDTEAFIDAATIVLPLRASRRGEEIVLSSR